MQNLSIDLRNCYGIQRLQHEFNLSSTTGKRQSPAAKAYAIYAPNGTMKTSFARTFGQLGRGQAPAEQRFGREATATVLLDGESIDAERIHVLRAEVDLKLDEPTITNLLVNAEHKAAYDALIAELADHQKRVINDLQKASGVKKKDIEQQLVADFPGSKGFVTAVEAALGVATKDEYSAFKYADIFDPKALAVLQDPTFAAQADEFAKRYNALFEQAGSIYRKGVFNPIKANIAFAALEKQDYFATGHKVHLAGDAESLDLNALNKKLAVVNQQIEDDAELKAIQEQLAKNASAQTIATFIEQQPASVVQLLLQSVAPGNQRAFKQGLWAFYLRSSTHAHALIETYESHKQEMQQVERQAAEESPLWQRAIELFNQRFIDMPYELHVENPARVALGNEAARLVCHFKSGDDSKSVPVSEIENQRLSQGERRAFYLLNFIFEVERRKRDQQPTLFVIDDPADSFDYKNKHAILQYLQDQSREPHFAQIILTCNFDLFRSLANSFVNYKRCLMASRDDDRIQLQQAEGIKNIFVKKWKGRIFEDDVILCACIPFVRNLIEYTKGEDESEYITLTSLLHWKKDTMEISVDEFRAICKHTLALEDQPDPDPRPLIDILFDRADDIAASAVQPGLNLANKVLLSIAIRLKAERYMTDALRHHYQQPDYWCGANGAQFGALVKEYQEELPDNLANTILENVSITVSSNIHLNSFMYEPILDLTQQHLVSLYKRVDAILWEEVLEDDQASAQ